MESIKFVSGVDKQFYNQRHMTKVSLDNKASFCVHLKLAEDEICVTKKLTSELDANDSNIYCIDESLTVNLDNIMRVSFKGEYCYFMTVSKIQHKTQYVNYNIKATGKNDYIKHKLRGEPMWVEIDNNFYNTDNINNIVVNENDMIINFKNTESSKREVESVRASYLIADNHDISEFTRSEEWVQVGNRFVNLRNVYNVKYDERFGVVYFNFTSNVSKFINGKKILSTEFVKHECTEEQFERLKQIIQGK